MALEYTAPPPPAPTPPLVISGTPYFLSMFNPAGDNIVDSVLYNHPTKKSIVQNRSNDSGAWFTVNAIDLPADINWPYRELLQLNQYDGVSAWLKLVYFSNTGNLIISNNNGAGGAGSTFQLRPDQADINFYGAILNVGLDEYLLNFDKANIGVAGSHDRIYFRKDTATDESYFEFRTADNANSGVRFFCGATYVFDMRKTSAKIFNNYYPTADGTLNQILKTDGAGNIGFTSANIAGSPLLINAKYISGIKSNAGTGDIDIYTVPAGKRAVVNANWVTYNTTGGGIDVYRTVKIAGTYYRIGAAVTIAANSQSTSLTQSNVLIYEAGETIAINTTATGLNLYFSILIFDDTSYVKSKKIITLANGDNTLYTVPNNYNAQVLGNNSLVAGTFVGAVQIFNSSGGARAYNVYVVSSGQAVSNSYKIQAIASAGNNVMQQVSAAGSLASGDYIVVNTNSGASNQFSWINVVEIPN